MTTITKNSLDGCSNTCTIEIGYNCTLEPSICTPICGDGRVLGLEVCDAGTSQGCLSDCLGLDPDWECSGGNETSPSVCT